MPRADQYLEKKRKRKQLRRERWGRWKKHRWEWVLNLVIISGWACFTIGVQALTSRPRIVWPIAVGLLLWGYAGYGYILRFWWRGFYTNMKTPPPTSSQGE